ncbi:hypothetical protein [Nonomuraea endophytica]|uniref:hypothetical protein n=1 Tax=Nonomuraea endophytica TaxID=714136 RepID=UPI0037CB10C4
MSTAPNDPSDGVPSRMDAMPKEKLRPMWAHGRLSPFLVLALLALFWALGLSSWQLTTRIDAAGLGALISSSAAVLSVAVAYTGLRQQAKKNAASMRSPDTYSSCFQLAYMELDRRMRLTRQERELIVYFDERFDELWTAYRRSILHAPQSRSSPARLRVAIERSLILAARATISTAFTESGAFRVGRRRTRRWRKMIDRYTEFLRVQFDALQLAAPEAATDTPHLLEPTPRNGPHSPPGDNPPRQGHH